MIKVRLRNLEKKDAPLMLEWMCDSSISCFFRFDAKNLTEKDCEKYITDANQQTNSKHFAIVNQFEKY